jgi:hypothetical protein
VLKLGAVRFVDIVYIDLEEFQPIALGLVSAKTNLSVVCFVLAYTVRHVSEEDLFGTPYV